MDPLQEVLLSRRNCLKLLGGAAFVAGTAIVLPACAAGSNERGTTARDRDAPLRIGMRGGSDAVLDITAVTDNNIAFALNYHLFDSLIALRGGTYKYYLATKITPNADATEWTITIRDGIKFHNGNPVTADDVLYSLHYIAQGVNGKQGYQYIDWDKSSSDGAQTVTLKLKQAQSSFIEDALGEVSFVFPKGTAGKDFETDRGSGPYKLVSFSADSGGVIEAWEDYWDGAPSIKRIEFVPIADPSAGASALLGGQIDFAHSLSPTDAANVESNKGFSVLDMGYAVSNGYKFCLNATKAPFDDPEVREAFKLIVDRKAMVGTILRGKGSIGNDVMGQGLPGYNKNLKQRELDFDRAAKIFKDKGIKNLEVLTSEITPGIKDSVDVLAQQMKKASVSLTVTEADPSTLFTTLDVIYGTQIFATYLINRPFVGTTRYTEAGSPWNFSQWADEEYNDLLEQGMKTSDEQERSAIYDKAQQRLWEAGSDVVWGYAPLLSGMISELSGVEMHHIIPYFANAKLS